jgi:hypothetical protein
MKWKLKHLKNYLESRPPEAGISVPNDEGEEKTVYVTARPLSDGTYFDKLKWAWMVIKGDADIVIWPETELKKHSDRE